MSRLKNRMREEKADKRLATEPGITDKQASGQADKQASGQADKQASRQAGSQTRRLADRQASSQEG